jgi:hypothetical protein
VPTPRREADRPGPTEAAKAQPPATEPTTTTEPDPVATQPTPANEAGYHDSLSGAAVDADGNFVGDLRKGEGPIPKHRIVANDWPAHQD